MSIKPLVFHVFDPLPGWECTASRYALSRLLCNRGVESDDPMEIKEAFGQLIDRRRQALSRLRKAGYLPLQDWLDFVNVMNCPAVCVLTRPTNKVWCCRRPYLCPFCWCRQYVMETYRRFNQWLFTEDGSLRYASRLLEVTVFDLCRQTPQRLERIFSTIKSTQKEVYNSMPSYGACVLSSVEPIKDHWLVKTRLLAIVDDDDALEIPEEYSDRPFRGGVRHRKVRCQRLEYGRQSLAASVGRFAAYPTALTTGPSKGLVNLLNGFPVRCRMREYYGQLRGVWEVDMEAMLLP